MFELWIIDQIDAAGANPWGDGCYDLWKKCRMAGPKSYARWMEFRTVDITPEIAKEIRLRRAS